MSLKATAAASSSLFSQPPEEKARRELSAPLPGPDDIARQILRDGPAEVERELHTSSFCRVVTDEDLVRAAIETGNRTAEAETTQFDPAVLRDNPELAELAAREFGENRGQRVLGDEK